MIIRTTFLFSLLFILNSCKKNKIQAKQDFATELKQLVLKQHERGQEYFIKVKKPKCVLEYEVAYIGDAYSKRDGLIKFVVFTVLSGNDEGSKRANSYVYLYGNDCALLGSYYVGGKFDVLPSIANDTFIFTAKSRHCDRTTLIGFKDSIPQEIFLNCDEENGKILGDIYDFNTGK